MTENFPTIPYSFNGSRMPDEASGQNIVYYLAMNIGQAEASILAFENQQLMVDTQQVQQRGLKIVDVNRILVIL